VKRGKGKGKESSRMTSKKTRQNLKNQLHKCCNEPFCLKIKITFMDFMFKNLNKHIRKESVTRKVLVNRMSHNPVG